MNTITKNELLQCFDYDQKYNHGHFTKLYVQQVTDQYMTNRNTSDPSSLPSDHLGELAIPARIRHALMRHGITDQDLLCSQSIKSLQIIPGIGKDAAMKIETALKAIGRQLEGDNA